MRRLLTAVALAGLMTAGAACVNGPRWERTMALAKSQGERGRLDLAERTLLDALAQADRLHALHPYQLETNKELARLYFRMKAYAQAKAALTRLVAKLDALYGPEHPGVGQMRADLGRACDALGQFDEAAAHYAAALPAVERAPAESQIDYLYLDMAVNAANRRRDADAGMYFDRAQVLAQQLHPGGPILEEIRSKRAEWRGGVR